MEIPTKKRLFLTFMLFGFFLIATSMLITLTISQNSINTIALSNAKNQFLKDRNILQLSFEDVEPKLIAIKDAKIFQKYLQKKDFTNQELKDYFLNIIRSSNIIAQLRLINLNGDEVIRVERKAYGAIPYIVPKTDLQNKKNRYYFQMMKNLTKSQIGISNLDLNIEHNTIQKPLVPIIRVGTPVYLQNKKIALLVINVFMDKALQMIQSSQLYNVYLIDNEGNFLIHKNPKYNWSKYLHKGVSVKDFFPDYKAILSKDQYMGETLYAATLNIKTPQHLKLIIEPTQNFLQATQKDLYKNIIINFIVLLLFAMILAIWLAKPYIKLEDKLKLSNKTLQHNVEEKTQELIELNKNLEQKIKERTKEQNILLSLFDLGDAVLFKWNNDATWSVASVSQSVTKLLGYTPEEFLQAKITYAACIHPEDIKQVTQEVEEAIEKKLYFFTHKPYRVITKEKKIKWIHDETVIVRDDDGKITHFVGYLIDITTIKENEIKLKLLSTTDKLTQIYNRLYLDDTLKQQYYRLQRNDEICSIIIMDIDHFKQINDKYGHLVGDKVLQQMTQLIKENIRQSDTFGRWGGEEFMIIAPYTSKEEAINLAQKLQEKIERFSFDTVGKVTMSFGVTECKKTKTLDENIVTADKALYHSKENGRNQVSFFD